MERLPSPKSLVIVAWCLVKSNWANPNFIYCTKFRFKHFFSIGKGKTVWGFFIFHHDTYFFIFCHDTYKQSKLKRFYCTKKQTSWNISHLLRGGAFSWKSPGSLCLNASFDYLLNQIQFKTSFTAAFFHSNFSSSLDIPIIRARQETFYWCKK